MSLLVPPTPRCTLQTLKNSEVSVAESFPTGWAALGFVVFQRGRRLHFEMPDDKVWDHGSRLPKIGTWIEGARERERERESASFFSVLWGRILGVSFFLIDYEGLTTWRGSPILFLQSFPGLDLVVSQPDLVLDSTSEVALAESQVGLDLQICLEQWCFHVSKPRCPHQPWALAMESIRFFGVGWLWWWWWWWWWRKVNNPKVKLVFGGD